MIETETFLNCVYKLLAARRLAAVLLQRASRIAWHTGRREGLVCSARARRPGLIRLAVLLSSRLSH
jgi:hypothetical protein